MAGRAVKVTEVPLHIGLTEGDMVTLTGRFGLTISVMVDDVAGEPAAQVALEVSTQVTASLLLNADEL